jgi:hypothetical protein
MYKSRIGTNGGDIRHYHPISDHTLPDQPFKGTATDKVRIVFPDEIVLLGNNLLSA